MYEQPELFEAAFSMLFSHFDHRRPVIDALQEVILLSSEDLYKATDLLTVYYSTDPEKRDLVDEATGALEEKGAPKTDDMGEQSEIQHVRHLRSFRQLLRRGAEAYELWSIVESDTVTEEQDPEQNAEEEKSNPGDKTARELERDQDLEWFKKLLAYLVLFTKFCSSKGIHGGTRPPLTLSGTEATPIKDFVLHDFDFEYDQEQSNTSSSFDVNQLTPNPLHQDLLRGMHGTSPV